MQHPAREQPETASGPGAPHPDGDDAAPRPGGETKRAILTDGTVDPAFRGALDLAVPLYRQMLRLRLISARMVDLQRAERIAFHSACLGEEAAIVSAALAVREQDWVFPGTREWGVALVRGLPLATYVHHAFGVGLDPARGHAAPDHLPARSVRVAPASGVLGAHLPQAVGAAWAAKIKKDDVATLAVFGDGAASSGDFHNALNFAGVFKAPCVLVSRVPSSSPDRAAARPSSLDRAAAYGLASAQVDGTDALAVVTVLRAAIARAGEGKGAALVEVVTGRLVPALAEGAWRTAEIVALGDGDPLPRLRRVLERERLLDASAHDALLREAQAEIEAAVADAERGAPPAPSSIFEHVYADVPPHLIAQKESSTWR